MNFISKLFKSILLAGALLYIIVYVILAVYRIQYPFELEWQEGAFVDHVRWILSGHRYYDSPSIEFVASIYTPLYFYSSALLSKITGIGFFPLRLISFVSSLGSFIIIFLMVRRETENVFSGIIATGLFAATYNMSGSWFDIGRSDSLFLFLLLAALYVLRFYDSSVSYLGAGILISLSYLTKQTALVISLPVMLYCVLIKRRSAVFFIAPIVIIMGLGSIFLNYIHDGWFNYYVFELPRTTPVDYRYLVRYWTGDILTTMFFAFPVAIFYIISLRLNSNNKNFAFYMLAAIGMIIASWYSRFRGGGYYNVLMPAYAITSILFGLGLNKLLEMRESFSADKKHLMKIFIYLACIVQFMNGSLIYNPLDQVPTKKDMEAGRKLIGKMSQIKGEVFMPFHGSLAAMAGKKSYVNMMGMRDVLTTSDKNHQDIKNRFTEELKQAIREKKFAAVIINSFEPWYPPDLEKYYIKKEKIFDDETVFIPVTGLSTRPEFIYVPKD
ncbi:MAG: hypothetical protein C4560_02435 [Nitrospiraceae bacterium]|nr:MAG: hypothetical protein C4560_02435 [Nitrospiraceae bacterium]